MKLKNEIVSVLVVRGAGRRNISFNLSLATLRLLSILVVVFLVCLSLFVVFYGRISMRFAEVSALVRENSELKEKVRAVESIYGEIDRIRSYERKIKTITRSYADTSVYASSSDTGSGDLFTRDEGPFERDVDGFVQNIRLQRDRDFSTITDPDEKRRRVLAAAPNVQPVDGWISRGYAGGADDATGEHPGIDIAAAAESPIKAAGPGIVTFAGWKKDMGFFLEIDHGYGFVSRYGHCARLLVKKGDLVDRSQTVAVVGNTGRSSAPHLHFEVTAEGRRVDPMMYLLH